ncbi:MAG: hypothetical protein RLZ67_427, partial [Actinomycetota bacterium]
MASNTVTSLFDWLDNSPTPFHVVDTAQRRLSEQGFVQQSSFSVPLTTRGYYCVDGAIIAWRLGDARAPYRIVGAHTDSPNFRIQPTPDITGGGWSQLGVEIYGGVLVNSWLDRDLGLAGRVIDADGQQKLFAVHEPLARIPQL